MNDYNLARRDVIRLGICVAEIANLRPRNQFLARRIRSAIKMTKYARTRDGLEEAAKEFREIYKILYAIEADFTHDD
jgi:hypothetical protein